MKNYTPVGVNGIFQYIIGMQQYVNTFTADYPTLLTSCGLTTANLA
jgi:hypothetical protein